MSEKLEGFLQLEHVSAPPSPPNPERFKEWKTLEDIRPVVDQIERILGEI